MGIKQLYNDNLRKWPNEYGDVSVMKPLAEYNVSTMHVPAQYVICSFPSHLIESVMKREMGIKANTERKTCLN